MFFFTLLIVLGSLSCSQGATPAQWRGRSIYQVFTDRFARTDGSTSATCTSGYEGFCGGTWKGITSKLDYIQVRSILQHIGSPTLTPFQGMGFTAIWISPVVEQITVASRAYHGYSAKNIYGLNSNFGTAADLKALASALHSRGMVRSPLRRQTYC